MGRRIIRDYLPAGLEVTVRTPSGKVLRHKLREDVSVSPHSDRVAADPLSTRLRGDPLSKPSDADPLRDRVTVHKGYEIFYSADYGVVETEFEEFCDCGGKGRIEQIFYGPYRNTSYRVRCSKVCKFVPKRKRR